MSVYSGATVGWLAISAVFAGIIAFELSEEAGLAPTVTAAPIEAPLIEPDDTAPASVVSPALDLLDEIIGRPLFSASRRPQETISEEQPVEAPLPAQKLSFELVGTMLSGSASIVLLSHPEKGLLRLSEGQTIEGWEVGEIGHNTVELRNGEEFERLKLRADLLQPKRPAAKALKRPGKNNEGEPKAVFQPPDAMGKEQPVAKQ